MHKAAQIRHFDRRLFMAVAVLFPLVIFAGFARTYYLRELFDVPPISTMAHVHGLVMTAWVGLFCAQVWLVASRRIRVHQRLGYSSIALAVLILATGLVTAIRAAKYGSPSTPPGAEPLSFLLVPLTDLMMFAIFYGAALYYRKRPASHKRLMLLTALNFLPPAVARIPSLTLQQLGPVWFFGLPGLLALVCLGLDARRNGMNRVFLIGTMLMIASYVVRLAVMETDAWRAAAEWLIGFV